MGKKTIRENTMSPENIAKAAEIWVASNAGRLVLEDALKRINDTIAQLSNERFVDSQTLRMPLSI